MPEPVLLSRRELYDLVWSKPMRDVAADFGISDVGLAKVCERHRVPRPVRGYWAKLAAGKKAKRAIFVDIDNAQLNRIVIRGALSQLPEAAKLVIEEARAEHRKKGRRPRLPAVRPPVEPVADVHPAIARTAQKLRKSSGNAGEVATAFGEGLCGVDIAAAQVERAVAFLDGLARRLDGRNLPLQPTGQAMKVERGEDSAVFTLKERTRREKHIPTPAEEAAEKKRQRKLQQPWQPSTSWDELYRPSYPEFDWIYTGGFVLQVEGYSDGIRRSWGDGRTQTVESLLENIAVGIDTLLAARKAKREEREEWRRQQRELDRRRAMAEEREEREGRRIDYLRELLDLHGETNRLRAWLVDIGRPDIGKYDDLARMIDWARARLSQLEAAAEADGIDQDLHVEALFPHIDELHDPLGDPPPEEEY
ncbi:MAG: hypothetical protein WDN01_07940 [Rhizomicrobium sp.]